MKIIDHREAHAEDWRPGVTTRMLHSAVNGAAQLCIFEQWCDPGLGAPVHLHAVEEVLDVLEGSAEITLGETTVTVKAGQSVLVPAGRWHGFRNTGTGVLHVRATLAAPVFEASYQHRDELSRRYLPE